MDWIIDLLTNRFLITGISSWFIAQVLKTIIYAIMNKRWDFSRMVGDGGMPSGHSATVTPVAVFSALTFGANSFEFAVSAILAIIVCHDATGVRRETGKQAILLNGLIEAFEVLGTQELPEVKLKEFVGHTPVQVVAGMLLGAANALLMFWILP
jgi:acid phosphatase family membrane protein YuiD